MVLRPLAERDVAELERIHRTPEVARWWRTPREWRLEFHEGTIVGPVDR